MTRRFDLRRLRRDDTGASLIVVLVIITFVSLIGGALLSLTGTGINNSAQLRLQAQATHNADGAVEAAINNIRNSNYVGNAGTQCFGATDTLTLNGFYGADSAVVNCTADPSRVIIHCPSLSNCNRPGSAILTMGKAIADEDGVHIEQPNDGSVFRVHGGIFSNSNINVNKGTLTTNSWAYARDACTHPTAVVSLPAANCNFGTGDNDYAKDPNYQIDATAVPQRRSVPDQNCTSPKVVEFEPGYYDDAWKLSEMMSPSSKCQGSTWWFKPGDYYFDFHNDDTSTNRNTLLSKSANEWKITSGYLVAGTPVNAAGAAIAAPAINPTIPGACDNPIGNRNAKGVQFVFGGDSRLSISGAGQAEICGTYRVEKPPVAIYGAKSGSETVSPVNTARATHVIDAGKFSGVEPANLDADDDLNASWTRKNGATTSTVVVDGFAPQTGIPVGSLLTSAKLRVVHRRSAGQPQLSVVVPTTGITPYDHDNKNGNKNILKAQTVTTPAAQSSVAADGFQTDTWTLDSTDSSPVKTALYLGTLANLRLELTATLGDDQTQFIDAVQLDLTYVPPAFQAAKGCVAKTGYNGTGGTDRPCAMVRSDNGSGRPIYVQGTTYAPLGVVDISLNNAAQQVFRFGIIVRSLQVKVTGSYGYSGAVIEVPDDSPGFAFSIYLTGYVCPNAATCTAATGMPLTRTRVAFVDPFPVPQAGQRKVVVLSWNHPG